VLGYGVSGRIRPRQEQVRIRIERNSGLKHSNNSAGIRSHMFRQQIIIKKIKIEYFIFDSKKVNKFYSPVIGSVIVVFKPRKL
jgi:hypothetical protein